MNEFRVFTDDYFGELRTTEIDGILHFDGITVAAMLHFSAPEEAVEVLCLHPINISYTIDGEQYTLPYIDMQDVAILLGQISFGHRNDIFRFVDFITEVLEVAVQ